jgi:chemotaxis protein methyltransferase CheR
METRLLHADVIKMTEADFKKLSEYIYEHYGIKMPITKKPLLESRLQKRLRENRITSFKHYIDYLFTPHGQSVELIPMVNAVTTNKTNFFRESDHFTFLSEVVLPDLVSRKVTAPNIWSAGCSTGEEPYTLAMVLSDYSAARGGLNYSILGTDLSTDVLQRAVNAVYTEDMIVEIPLAVRRRYLLQSKSREAKVVKIAPALRERITFQRLNLMDDHYGTLPDFHVVFCRNVLIYFDRPTQERVINKLAAKLERGGYLFVGHSESLTQMQVPLRQIRPTIFQKL